MIFTDIHIDGFGIYHDYSLAGLKKGVNIILGENEAGKTTLQKFLKFTLTGYPRLTDKRMAPINGGNHAGRIKAISSTKDQLVFERDYQDHIKLLINDKEFGDQLTWDRYIGGASSDLYSNVYAFSLDELAGMDSLTESGVNDKIFSLGLGMGNVSIKDIASEIKTQVDQIYKKSGHKHRLKIILNEISECKLEINRIQSALPQYSSLNEEILELNSTVEEVKKEKGELSNQSQRLERYRSCYSSFVGYSKAEEELTDLPDLQAYPTDIFENYSSLKAGLRTNEEAMLLLQKGDEGDRGIEDLKKESDKISLNQELFDQADKVSYLQSNREKYISTLDDKNEDERLIKESSDTISTQIKTIDSSWEEKDIDEFSEDIIHKNAILEFQEKFSQVSEEERMAIARQGQGTGQRSTLNIKLIIAVIASALLIGAIPAFVYEAYILGAALVLIAGLLFISRNRMSTSSSGSVNEPAQNNWQAKKKKLEDEFQDYLKNNLRLKPDLTPTMVLDIISTISVIKKEMRDRQRLIDKNQDERAVFIREFENTVSELIDISGIEARENNDNAALKIIEAYDHAVAQKNSKQSLEAKIEEKSNRLDRLKESSAASMAKLNELFKSIEAADEEEFKKKIESNERVKELLQQKENAETDIESASGLGTLSEVLETLKKRTLEEVENDINELKQQIETIERENSETDRTLGQKQQERDTLMTKSELADLLTQYETAKQKLQEAYKEWLTGRVALKVLEKQKEEYELTKQPEVIKNTTSYFSKITDDAYKSIRVSLEDQTVAIYNAQGKDKKIEHLSRGTKEQLLICLRLGYISDYEKNSEPLPIIADEILVNFDPERARRTAQILHSFAKQRQVLLFTCHPSTAELFGELKVNQITL